MILLLIEFGFIRTQNVAKATQGGILFVLGNYLMIEIVAVVMYCLYFCVSLHPHIQVAPKVLTAIQSGSFTHKKGGGGKLFVYC